MPWHKPRQKRSSSKICPYRFVSISSFLTQNYTYEYVSFVCRRHHIFSKASLMYRNRDCYEAKSSLQNKSQTPHWVPVNPSAGTVACRKREKVSSERPTTVLQLSELLFFSELQAQMKRCLYRSNHISTAPDKSSNQLASEKLTK